MVDIQPHHDDELIATMSGADIIRACGCVERLDPNWDAWVLLTQCRECEDISVSAEWKLRKIVDHERDADLAEAAGGHRVRRLRPKDDTVKR